MISYLKFKKSLHYAMHGMRVAFRHEHSFRLHLFALVVLVAAMFFFRLRPTDVGVLLVVATVVIVLELVNSIFERFIDIVEPRVGAQVRDLKDLMAAAVLVASFGAAVIGTVIIYPYLLR